ncbi:dihydropteroate synthase, partial [Bacteroidales bacterium OttesenSCG-928-K22]|nr:dihydropteroate synthase [Bacteroidales bacterium OttesenSCG-928-L14]MDL2241227.1 dihydropteroate synthase [Bacteroidales bacterium OttesenSCG-928-K22]
MDRCKIMGIVNVTPDSFYSGSRYNVEKYLLQKVEEMIGDGADIIDIGGVSTRPGSAIVSAAEEEQRVIPAVKSIKKHFPRIEISVDTFRAVIADKACDEGCKIINDISGGIDKNLFHIVAKHKAQYVLMHYYGDEQGRMQEHHYTDIISEMMEYFTTKISELKSVRVEDIIIDPGFGFSKTIEENYCVLNQLSKFKEFGYPILAGLSRKSMIYKLLNITPEES